MQQRLIELLERDQQAIADAWQARLSDPARLAAGKLVPAHPAPTRPLLREVIRLAADSQQPVATAPIDELLGRLGPSGPWRINLRQAVEVLLTGEVVVRAHARHHLEITDEELWVMVELINRVFHNLLRAYTERYCDQCIRLREIAD